jgi:hypothetical protein
MKSFYRFIGTGVGVFGLLVQYYLIVKPVDNISFFFLETIRYFSFMTIWSNIVVTAAFFIPLVFPASRLGRFFQRSATEAAVTVYIFIVMLVYHFFLAQVWEPQGWQKVVDINLHYVTPLLYILFWILFCSKEGLRYVHTVKWLIYPAVYVMYSLIRGLITNQYPYYFADVSKLGWSLAMRNMLLVIVAYWLVGMILVMLTRLIPPIRRNSDHQRIEASPK